jgi:dolichol-phosphate mannosyltransferase
MDADFSHDPKALIDMAAALKDNDLVIGSRYVPGGSVDERWPIWRNRVGCPR